MPRRKNDLSGKKFNSFTVLQLSDRQNESKEYLWKCKCDCGEIRYLTTQKVKSQKSCGCKKKVANGMSNTKLYRIWNAMKQRCYNSKNPKYKYYGEKGIKICDEWLNSFTSFYNWSISNGYREGLSIERKNPKGNYEPSNCEWVTISENTIRSNVNMSKLYEFNGLKMSLHEWSEELGIKYKTLHKRLSDGWSVEEAFSTELHGRRKK